MKKAILLLAVSMVTTIMGFLTTDIQGYRGTRSFSAVVNPFNAYPYYGMRYANWRRTYPWKYRNHYWPYFPYDAQRMSAGHNHRHHHHH